MSNVSAAKVKSIAKSIADACGLVYTDASNTTYKANFPSGGTNYLSASSVTNLSEALIALDTAIGNNAKAITAETTARETADKELNTKITANKVSNTDKSITVTTATTGTDIKVNVKSGDNALKLDTDNGLYVDNSALDSYTGANAIRAGTTDTSTGIFVTATTTNNITDYAVGLLITGDDI